MGLSPATLVCDCAHHRMTQCPTSIYELQGAVPYAVISNFYFSSQLSSNDNWRLISFYSCWFLWTWRMRPMSCRGRFTLGHCLTQLSLLAHPVPTAFFLTLQTTVNSQNLCPKCSLIKIPVWLFNLLCFSSWTPTENGRKLSPFFLIPISSSAFFLHWNRVEHHLSSKM